MSYPTGGSSSPSGGCGRRIDVSRKQGPHCGDFRPTAIPFAWSSRGTAKSVVGTSVWTGRVLQAGFDDLETIGLALLYPALEWSVWLLAIMDIRAHPISFSKGPGRPLVPPDHGCDGETVSPSPQSNSQTSAGEPCIPRCVSDQPWTFPRRVPNSCLTPLPRLDARFVAAPLRQHRPSDPRQLVGECRCQNVMMQALRRSLEPRPKVCFAQFAGLSRITRAWLNGTMRKHRSRHQNRP